MAQNKRVTEETFGVDPKNPPLKKGSFDAFGHTIKDGSPIPSRGTSVNSKTGYPVDSK